jgi:nicotinic acid mononucleotide adenylyltransferase
VILFARYELDQFPPEYFRPKFHFYKFVLPKLIFSYFVKFRQNIRQKLIHKNDFQDNIHIVTERVPNMISSTCIRLAVRRGHSIRFLVAGKVVDYIAQNHLYKIEPSGFEM